MDLALQFPCVSPLIKQGFKRANHQVADPTSPSFGKSISRTGFNGDRRIWPQQKVSSSIGRSKKPSDERTSKQEEIISLLKRIQSSISKGGESQTVEEKKKKNHDESSENEPPLSKAILDVLEKPRKKTEGDNSVKEAPKRQQSSFAKRYIRPSASDSIELKEVAKNRGIKGYSKLKKSELLNLLKSS